MLVKMQTLNSNTALANTVKNDLTSLTQIGIKLHIQQPLQGQYFQNKFLALI